MKNISVKKMFARDYITGAAGERLRKMITEEFAAKKPIEIDFSDVVIASTSFFDEGIAKLKEEGWDGNRFEKFVVLKNLNARDARVLRHICKHRNFDIPTQTSTKSSRTPNGGEGGI